MSDLVHWNFTIDDTSPLFQYSPYGETNAVNRSAYQYLEDGWVTWYTGSSYLQNLGDSGDGDSYHLTSMSGASFSLSFYGTGISLYGQSNASYEVTFDGNSASDAALEDGVFFSTSNEPAGNHEVTLTAKPNSSDQILSFDRAIVTSAVNTSSELPTTLIVDNKNTSSINYFGVWIPNMTNPNVPSSSAPAPFHSASANGSYFSMNFIGRAVAVHGPMTYMHGQYSVSLDDAQQELNGTSEWLVGDTLLFFQDGLDDDTVHSLDVTNLGGGLSLNSVQVMQFASASSTLPSIAVSTIASTTASSEASSVASSSHEKSVVPAVVGAVVSGLAVIAGVGLFFWKRRRARVRRHSKIINLAQASSTQLTSAHGWDRHGGPGILTPYNIVQSSAALPASKKVDVPLLQSISTTRLPTAMSADFETVHLHSRHNSRIATVNPSNAPNMRHPAATPSAHLVASPVHVEDILEILARRIDSQRAPFSDGHARARDDASLPPYPGSGYR